MSRPPSPSSQALRHRLVRILSGSSSVAEAGQGVLGEIAGSFGSPLAILWLLDERTGLLRWGDDWSDRPELDAFRETCRRLTFAAGVGLPGRALATRETVSVDDLASDEQFPRAEQAIEAGLRSAIAAPLMLPGRATGVVEVFGEGTPALRPDQLDDLASAADQLAAYYDRVDIETRLRATEERSASTFRAALDCVVMMDHAGRIVDFNPAAEATFGFEREQVVGELLADRIIPPDLRQAHHRALAAYVQDREPTILNRRVELTGMRADGSTFPVELTVTRFGSSEPPMFVGFIRDITERREAELERDRLLADAVHERARAEAAGQRAAAARTAAEHARREAEVAGQRLALLARVGERMLAIRGYEDAMQQIVEVAVPTAADWCSLAVSESGQAIRNATGAHRDPAKRRLVQELIAREEPVGGAAAVIRSGRTELVQPVTDADLRRLARDEAHLQVLRSLGPRAILTVPLRSPRRAFGAITLAMAESGRSFEPDDIQMAESLAARAALAIENARLFSERSHIADTLQKSLLPSQLPDVPGLDLAARYRAAGEQNLVGGDFYDFFRSADGVWTAILGDVVGKGAEAAAETALTRHTLRAAALETSSPAACLRLLNEALLGSGEDDRTGRFATVVFTRIRRTDNGASITVSVGGHPPPIILRASGSLEYVDVRGTVLGALDNVELAEVDVQLDVGDAMFLYTDGVTEVRTHDARYGERLLERTLRKHARESADEIVGAVEQAVLAAQQDEPRDDIALLAMRVQSL